MQTQAPRSISFVRTIVLSAITALLIAAVALPAAAQNSVPASAAAAAKQPEFAAKLAHPTRRPAPQQHPTGYHPRPVPPLDPTVYDNGPINGSVDAWTINFGYAVTDSFTLSFGTTITSFQFGAWSYPGSTPISIDYSIGTSPFGGNPATVTVLSAFQRTNQYGYDIDLVTAAGLNVPLGPGTYWLTLQNAVVNTGDPLYWDENSGPSQAEDNVYGTIPSESFSVQATTGTPECFQSGGNLQIIHDFSPQEAGTGGVSGVVMDNAGNLYGSTQDGGSHSAGYAYKLSNHGGWLLDSLFDFFGGSTGSGPGSVIVGPNGSLYGAATGSIQNCGSDGSQYCGLIFNLAPQPVACRSTLCAWNETVPYQFTSESDGSGEIAVTASDQHGNLFGITAAGGAYDAGTVFELSPSGGGWTKTTLYSFTGGSDGTTPSRVLAGTDGNLYGVAGATTSNGIVFQLTFSSGQWKESVLYAFSGEAEPPTSLVQDGAGNLYGSVVGFPYGPIFTLHKTGAGWTYSEYYPEHQDSCNSGIYFYDFPTNLTTDPSGNLYGTGYGGSSVFGSPAKRRPPGSEECFYNYVFQASYDGTNWHYRDLDFLYNTYFGVEGSLALDASDRLYGATADCGANNVGTVWRISP